MGLLRWETIWGGGRTIKGTDLNGSGEEENDGTSVDVPTKLKLPWNGGRGGTDAM